MYFQTFVCLTLLAFAAYFLNESGHLQSAIRNVAALPCPPWPSKALKTEDSNDVEDIRLAMVGQPERYSQKSRDKFNLFQHTGGIGPYIEHSGFGISVSTPEACKVKQVHVLARHTERYPTPEKTFHATVNKLKGAETLNGTLEFLKDYKFFITEPSKQYGRLTWTGPYNGIDEARKMGEKYKERYEHLYRSLGNDVLPIFTSSSSRVIATAKQFGVGFFGPDWETTEGKLVIVSESPASGGDSLTPDKSCKVYDKEYEHMNYHHFFHKYFARALARVQKQTSAHVTFQDVQNLVEMCYFEFNTDGKSDFCNIFEADDHVAYGYTRALRYFYRNGPGNPHSANVGSVYANATIQLLNENDRLPFYFSFSHDTHLNFFYALLGMFSDGQPNLPFDFMSANHPWVDSILTPMGAHIAIEKLSCEENDQENEYVRFVINDAVIPYHNCQSGPGYSCPLSDFTADIQERIVNNPYSICENDKSLPTHIKFFWDWRSHVNKIEPEIL